MKKVMVFLAILLSLYIGVCTYTIMNLKSEVNDLKIAVKFIEAKNKAQDNIDDKLTGLLKRYFDSINRALENEGVGI